MLTHDRRWDFSCLGHTEFTKQFYSFIYVINHSIFSTYVLQTFSVRSILRNDNSIEYRLDYIILQT